MLGLGCGVPLSDIWTVFKWNLAPTLPGRLLRGDLYLTPLLIIMCLAPPFVEWFMNGRLCLTDVRYLDGDSQSVIMTQLAPS